MAAFVGWGNAWGSAWGGAGSSGAMQGAASFALSATANPAGSPGLLQGTASFALSAELSHQPPEPPAAATAGSNKRRPQIQWLPAHVPYVAPHLAAGPRRRSRKARDTDLLFLGR